MPQQKIYEIFPLGDAALTIDFGNSISEKINDTVLNLFYAMRQKPLPGMIEAIPAYSSLSIFYNPFIVKGKIPVNETAFGFMKKETEKFIAGFSWNETPPIRIMKIPVCYDEEFATDLERMAGIKKMDKAEIIRLHYENQYRVYMIGFLPGFPYMGILDEKISLPRKSQPQQVAPGSVGIAGRQAGIYPFNCPGGWNIIGRTPMKLFDPLRQEQSLLHAGDTVEFYPIEKNEFLNLIK